MILRLLTVVFDKQLTLRHCLVNIILYICKIGRSSVRWKILAFIWASNCMLVDKGRTHEVKYIYMLRIAELCSENCPSVNGKLYRRIKELLIYFVYYMTRDANFKEMLDLLAVLKTGKCHGLKVRVGRLQVDTVNHFDL